MTIRGLSQANNLCTGWLQTKLVFFSQAKGGSLWLRVPRPLLPVSRLRVGSDQRRFLFLHHTIATEVCAWDRVDGFPEGFSRVFFACGATNTPLTLV